jgi:hypothetical protein
MNALTDRRDEIYNHFHANQACRRYFFDPGRESEYAAYYNSMYLLQDATESLVQHRGKGFASDDLTRYIEFWGVMQAVIIQQDSIAEIYGVLVGQPLLAKALQLAAWSEIRELRNVCAGHPANKSRPKSQPLSRAFIGRMGVNYDTLTYELWQQGATRSHPQVNLEERCLMPTRWKLKVYWRRHWPACSHAGREARVTVLAAVRAPLPSVRIAADQIAGTRASENRRLN